MVTLLHEARQVYGGMRLVDNAIHWRKNGICMCEFNHATFMQRSLQLQLSSHWIIQGRHEKALDVIVGKHIILQHQKKVLFGEDFQRVNIRRRNLFGDAFAKPHFNVSKMLKIRFIGEESVIEESVDDGGPCREFFRLLMKESFTTSGLFVGWPSNVVPKYYIVGRYKVVNLHFVLPEL